MKPTLATLSADQAIHAITEGYLYIECTCGKPLMIWPNLTEKTHHVPLTKKCGKYKMKIRTILELHK